MIYLLVSDDSLFHRMVAETFLQEEEVWSWAGRKKNGEAWSGPGAAFYGDPGDPDTFSEVEDPAPAMFPPVEAPSTAELSTKIDAAATRTDASITSAQDAADSARTVSIVAIIVALVAIVLGAIGWQRARKATTA